MDAVLDSCKNTVRHFMRKVARSLNAITGGKLSPNTITGIGLIAHLPIALLIAYESWYWAAGLLVVFGLFDTLDGELARLQKTTSHAGMLLDSTTDRMKEIVLYMGIGYVLVSQATTNGQDAGLVAVLLAAACGGSVLVSYINAWGEVVMGQAKRGAHQVNQTFRSGLMRFEVRMFLLIVGLASGKLVEVVAVIAVLAWLTAFMRLSNILKRLHV